MAIALSPILHVLFQSRETIDKLQICSGVG